MFRVSQHRHRAGPFLRALFASDTDRCDRFALARVLPRYSVFPDRPKAFYNRQQLPAGRSFLRCEFRQPLPGHVHRKMKGTQRMILSNQINQAVTNHIAPQIIAHTSEKQFNPPRL